MTPRAPDRPGAALAQALARFARVACLACLAVIASLAMGLHAAPAHAGAADVAGASAPRGSAATSAAATSSENAAAWPLVIERAEFVRGPDPADATARALAAPPADARWSEVRLPHRWSRTDSRSLAVAWYRVRFSLDGPPPRNPVVYFSRLATGGALFLNGKPVADVRAPDDATHVRWRQPRLVALAPDALVPGPNELVVRVVTRDAGNGFPVIEIGPESSVAESYAARFLTDHTGAQLNLVVSASVGLFMIGIGVFRRREPFYLYFGASCLLWSLRTYAYIAEVMPYAWYWAVRSLFFFTTGAAGLALIAFFHSYVGGRWQRGLPLMLAYVIAGPLLLLASGGRLDRAMAVYWQGGLVPFFFVGLWVFSRGVFAARTVEGTLLLAAVVLATLFSLNDYAAAVGWLPYTQVIALHLGLPLVFAAMGGVLAVRFVRALNDAEQANERLEERLAQKEAELAEKYELLRVLERREVANAERQRIMQDLHDGLGSQLVSSLMLIEKGGTAHVDVARLLREAVDDMRLAIDALSPGDGDLQSALANLRYRLEPRLRAAGVTLSWRVDEAPGARPVGPHLSLQVLRVVQEAISNAMRHGGASRIGVAVALDEREVRAEIRDDGRGFDEQTVRAGRGLQNMRQRAHTVNGSVSIESGTGGTVVRLACPLGAEPTGTPGHDVTVRARAGLDEYRGSGIATGLAPS